MWTFNELLVEMRKQTAILKQMEKNQEVLIAKSDQIIALLTPPEFGSASFVVGQPEHN
jgi:hypothetical protein